MEIKFPTNKKWLKNWWKKNINTFLLATENKEIQKEIREYRKLYMPEGVPCKPEELPIIIKKLFLKEAEKKEDKEISFVEVIKNIASPVLSTEPVVVTSTPPLTEPIKEEEEEIQKEEILTLTNSIGISYSFPDPMINQQRIRDLLGVGFIITKGVLPDGIVIESATQNSATTVETTLVPEPTNNNNSTITNGVVSESNPAKVYVSSGHVVYDSFYAGQPNANILVVFIEASDSDLYLDNIKNVDLEIISDDFTENDLNIRFDTETQNKSYIPAGQRHVATLIFDPPTKSGKFQVILKNLEGHVLPDKAISFDGLPITTKIISVTGVADNLNVNITQVPLDSINDSYSPSYIAKFEVDFDEGITLDEASFTFNNSDPLARLYNVDVQGDNVPVIAPGSTIKFSNILDVTADSSYKTFVLKSNSNELGWDIVLNSVVVKRKYFPTLPVSVTGLPINIFPRDRKLTLKLSPATQSGLIPLAPNGRPKVLEINMEQDYRNLYIKEVTLLLEGQTVTSSGTTDVVSVKSVNLSRQYVSGTQKTYSPDNWSKLGGGSRPTIIIELNLAGAQPGTKWKATLKDIEFATLDSELNVLEYINEVGLPISNEIYY